MECELFALLVRMLGALPCARRRPPRSTFSDQQVLAVALWAALHERPISWATRRENWPFHDRTRALPSNATMSRRMRHPEIETILERLRAAMRITGEGELTLVLDGRKLLVALHTGDRDAGFIRRNAACFKGYALHAIVDLCGNHRGIRVEPLNISEQAAARELIASLTPSGARTLLADASYDSNALYELAGERGIQMLAERRYRDAKGIGHHRHSEHRLRALEVMRNDPGALRDRRYIESCFGTQGNTVGGLGPLPNHVRGLERVRRWVSLKLTIDAAHRWLRNNRAAA